MAAKYIFNNSQLSGLVSKLSGTTKGLATGIVTNPHKMENIINVVRTAAPLTSTQTVSKLNTYLPAFEKFSTLLGMYSFLTRAQNYTPIQSAGGKTPIEKITGLMKNGNIPIAKLLAQPVLANNMNKIMSSAVKDMVKSGDFNDILSSMSKQFSSNQKQEGKGESSENSDIDLESLINTFMPILSSMSSDSSSEHQMENNEEEQDSKKTENSNFDNYEVNNDKNPENSITGQFKSATILPDESDDKDNSDDNTKTSGQNEPVNESNEDLNQYSENKKYNKPKPINIRRRRRKSI